MTDTPLDTISLLIDGALADTDDKEARYKLRTASQLIDVVKQHQSDLVDAVESVEVDDDVRERLEALGYDGGR